MVNTLSGKATTERYAVMKTLQQFSPRPWRSPSRLLKPLPHNRSALRHPKPMSSAIQQSFTKTRNSDGSESISKFTKDAFGNKQRVTKTHNADGSESFSKFSADADGNKKKVTKTRNPDGSKSVSITKTSTGSSAIENRKGAGRYSAGLVSDPVMLGSLWRCIANDAALCLALPSVHSIRARHQ